jgi:hypothetical protein
VKVTAARPATSSHGSCGHQKRELDGTSVLCSGIGTAVAPPASSVPPLFGPCQVRCDGGVVRLQMAQRRRARAPAPRASERTQFVGICPLLCSGWLASFFREAFLGPEKLRAAPGERGVATTALSHLRTCSASVLGFYWLACFTLCRVTSWLSSHSPRETCYLCSQGNSASHRLAAPPLELAGRTRAS